MKLVEDWTYKKGDRKWRVDRITFSFFNSCIRFVFVGFVSSEPPSTWTIWLVFPLCWSVGGVDAVWNLISLFTLFFRTPNNFLIQSGCIQQFCWWNLFLGDMRFCGNDCVLKMLDFWLEFCMESLYFFLFIDGVYFLYRKCGFLHARLDFVFCVSASLSAAFWHSRLPCCFPALQWLDSDLLALLAFLTGSNGVC